eukprot:jgi/Ulvmu1/10359/UM061_0042.1
MPLARLPLVSGAIIYGCIHAHRCAAPACAASTSIKWPQSEDSRKHSARMLHSSSHSLPAEEAALNPGRYRATVKIPALEDIRNQQRHRKPGNMLPRPYAARQRVMHRGTFTEGHAQPPPLALLPSTTLKTHPPIGSALQCWHSQHTPTVRGASDCLSAADTVVQTLCTTFLQLAQVVGHQ